MQVANWFRDAGIAQRLYGYGISACVPVTCRSCVNLATGGIGRRDRGQFAAVYFWTVDIESQIDDLVLSGCDGEGDL